MPKTLYFSHPETQAVQKVTNVVNEPVIYTLGATEEIWKAPHRDVFEEIYADELGSSVSSQLSSSGSNNIGWAQLTTERSMGSGSANASSSRIWVVKAIDTGETANHSDERVHAPHRQDQIKLNYWKVSYMEGDVETFCMLSHDHYPDFAPNAPGWWTDPNP